MYTLGEAAKATSKSKSTIFRAIKAGRVSASKNALGKYEIDPAELHRVYRETNDMEQNANPRNAEETVRNRAELAAVRQLAEERQRQLEDQRKTIDDLRSRLDQESEERRKLSIALLPMREQPKPPELHPGFWRRLVGG